MARIELPKRLTRAGGALYDIANELMRGSDDGNVFMRMENGKVIFEGNFTEYLDHDTLNLIMSENDTEIYGHLMVMEVPTSLLRTNVPAGITGRSFKEFEKESNRQFKEWIDSYVVLMFSQDGTNMYCQTDVQQRNPLKGSDLKLLIDNYQTRLLTLPEYFKIKSELV